MEISLIYARSRNHCIGRDGSLPWNLPDEFRFFTDTTMGHPVIMGRRSWEDHDGLLPGRLNIVVTHQKDYPVVDTARVATSLESALKIAGEAHQQAFVIGGAGLLVAAFPLARHVFETIVDADLAGDVYLPAFDFEGWTSVRLLQHAPDAAHEYGFSCFRRGRPGEIVPSPLC